MGNKSVKLIFHDDATDSQIDDFVVKLREPGLLFAIDVSGLVEDRGIDRAIKSGLKSGRLSRKAVARNE